MSRYVTLTDLKLYTGHTGTEWDAQLQDALDAAEGIIDDHTRRSFVGTPGTYYVSRYEQDKVVNQALYLDSDLFSLTGLLNGNSATIPTGSVWLEPRNEGPPYRILRLKSSQVWTWDTDGEVTVSGTWGYSTVAPENIQRATTIYAAYLFRQKDQTTQETIGFEPGGAYPQPRGIPRDVYDLLEKYRSRSGGVV